MTEQRHPITPPPELVQEWWEATQREKPERWVRHVATQAARWGADQELEACCEWLEKGPYGFSIAASASDLTSSLRATRRPKPPSLAEKALEALEAEDDAWPVRSLEKGKRFDTIRAALERLQELEGKQ